VVLWQLNYCTKIDLYDAFENEKIGMLFILPRSGLLERRHSDGRGLPPTPLMPVVRRVKIDI